ncbi:early activation antigen CD69-like [Phyllopteryx taeniolatus]|uniref:early activation antigen CD69-like n=1 Tax=Phyllopteryx taeniolatus TaxID=161469 RepID=UPI002AD3E932|nr:early activation antigen CD69-like [Phyllopteryx taeniolatus]XP_061631881.1 early activation antigen CD69-like [Phyllopteryx taeniolatus]
MEEVNAKKKQLEEDMATNKPMQEVRGERNPYTFAEVPLVAEAGPGEYTRLQKPSEDIYSNVVDPTKQPAKQVQGSVRPYRVACLILTVLCLVLLLVAIILLVKMTADSTTCPVSLVSWVPPTCSTDQCTAFTSQDRHQCYCCNQCPPGWLRLEESCFFLSTLKLSWEESQRNCLEKGGSLAVVSSHKVQYFLSQCGNFMKYWIGLRHNGAMWTWVDNTNLQQSYWGAYPTAGNCAILHSNGLPENWMTSSCSSYTYFICQMNLGTAVHQDTPLLHPIEKP